MPLKAIKGVLDEGTDRAEALLALEDQILDRALAGERTRTSATEVRKRYGVPKEVLDRLAEIGVLTPNTRGYSPSDVTIIEAICGFRMHPAWFRIGGVAADLPAGWDTLIRDFLDYLPKRLDEYDRLVMRNRIFKARTKGVGAYSVDEAIEWGITGPGLRACGLDWDYRRRSPYSCYDQIAFDIPTATHGDCYARVVVHIEEMRQRLRIIRQ